MKKATLIAMTVLAVMTVPNVAAAKPQLTVLLAGGAEESQISIALSPDGRSYVISSIVPLEVGGDLCWHPEGQPNELFCSAALIGGFEVNAGAGDDSITVVREVAIPVTLRGGPGEDRLIGGGGHDKLVGAAGNDYLVGRAGDDSLFGGPGADRIFGGSGDDHLLGDGGNDALLGGPGENLLVQ
jgi:hypothetical protein